VCRAIRPFASHAALPEVPCTAAAVFGLLQQASTVVNFSVDDYTALPDSILMLTPHQRISSITLQLFYICFFRPCALFKYGLHPNLFFSGDFRSSAIMEISRGPEPETSVCSDAVEFVMKLCNFVFCVVTPQKKAVLCCTGVEAMKLMQTK
jgi:hypothetical protein